MGATFLLWRLSWDKWKVENTGTDLPPHLKYVAAVPCGI